MKSLPMPGIVRDSQAFGQGNAETYHDDGKNLNELEKGEES